MVSRSLTGLKLMFCWKSNMIFKYFLKFEYLFIVSAFIFFASIANIKTRKKKRKINQKLLQQGEGAS